MVSRHDAEYVEFAAARMGDLYRIAYGLCGSKHTADDLVQHTLTTLYVKWRTAVAADNLDAYVRRMLVNTFVRERRRGWFTRVRLTDAVPEAAGPGVDLDSMAEIQRALARVPPRQRAVVVLRFVCDLAVTDVAEILGISEGTVKSQTAHGLAALRGMLAGPAGRAPVAGGRSEGRG
jgi:RNA polymerase sigma-70 factor (sigma-E family)